jgi:hypothetical protein
MGGTLAAAAALAAAFYVLGGRAAEATGAGHPAANVVGLPLAAATRELRVAGPVRIRVDKVPYGQLGIVQRVLGFEFDGTINSGSTIVLQVGTRRLKPWSITHLR